MEVPHTSPVAEGPPWTTCSIPEGIYNRSMAGQLSTSSSKRISKFIVFTDLDATLLDHHTYSWQPAAPAIEGLRERGYPLILCSSKTLAEMMDLAAELATAAPLVAENGAFIAIPQAHTLAPCLPDAKAYEDYLIEFTGASRDHILATAHALRNEHAYRFEGFADWTIAELSHHTGLDHEAATRAATRLATEPIVWNDTQARWEQFEAQLDQHDIHSVRGGRFIHLMGNTDKARGLESLVSLYRKHVSEFAWTSVALGDSPNDLGMLSVANIAVVIPNPNRSEILTPTSEHIIRAPHPGPQGWNAVISDLIRSSSNLDVGNSNDG